MSFDVHIIDEANVLSKEQWEQVLASALLRANAELPPSRDAIATESGFETEWDGDQSEDHPVSAMASLRGEPADEFFEFLFELAEETGMVIAVGDESTPRICASKAHVLRTSDGVSLVSVSSGEELSLILKPAYDRWIDWATTPRTLLLN